NPIRSPVAGFSRTSPSRAKSRSPSERAVCSRASVAAGEVSVRIAIAGAGVAGSYISRLLRLRGYRDVDVFDVRHRIACGIHPCGYGVDERFDGLVRLVGLDPSRYVLHVPPSFLAEVEGVAARTTVI